MQVRIIRLAGSRGNWVFIYTNKYTRTVYREKENGFSVSRQGASGGGENACINGNCTADRDKIRNRLPS